MSSSRRSATPDPEDDGVASELAMLEAIWGATNDYLPRPDMWGKKAVAIRVRPASQMELYACLAMQLPAAYPTAPPEIRLELQHSKGLSTADPPPQRPHHLAHANPNPNSNPLTAHVNSPP